MNVSWDDYYLNGAAWASMKSKDPSTKVGALLVSRHNRVIATGFNGLAPGVHDSDERLHNREAKYALTIHAEENALLSVNRDEAHGSAMYVHGAPVCERCMSRMIAMGVSRVVCHFGEVDTEKLKRWEPAHEIALKLAREAGIATSTFY